MFKSVYEQIEVPYIKEKWVLFPARCSVTGKPLPLFKKAKRRCMDYLTFDNDIITEAEWLSEEGYTFLKLQNKVP